VFVENGVDRALVFDIIRSPGFRTFKIVCIAFAYESRGYDFKT